MNHPTRGEVYWVNLEPTLGSEIKKARPAVIVSNEIINCNASVIVVCPITDAVDKTGKVHVFVPSGEAGLTKDSVVHCGQIRSVSKLRVGARMGFLPQSYMTKVEEGIRNTLSL